MTQEDLKRQCKPHVSEEELRAFALGLGLSEQAGAALARHIYTIAELNYYHGVQDGCEMAVQQARQILGRRP